METNAYLEAEMGSRPHIITIARAAAALIGELTVSLAQDDAEIECHSKGNRCRLLWYFRLLRRSTSNPDPEEHIRACCVWDGRARQEDMLVRMGREVLQLNVVGGTVYGSHSPEK